ncbi:MAG TPA: hypothetical protein VI731_10785, partial [Bacteroidia bacterium]|nr:hypothetical protein [Bacteroidia bacterium]
MSPSGRYFTRYAIYVLILAAALLAWNRYAPEGKTHSWSWAILIFLALVYAGGHLYLAAVSNDKNPNRFVRRFMTLTTLRLFVFLIIIVLFAFSGAQGFVSFTVHFL